MLLAWLVLPWAVRVSPRWTRTSQSGVRVRQLRGHFGQYEDILATHRHFELNSMRETQASNSTVWGSQFHYERAKLLSLQMNISRRTGLPESNIVDRITAVPSLLEILVASWVGPGQWLNWTLWALFWWTLTWVLWDLRWTKKNRDSRATLGFLGTASLALGLTGFWGSASATNVRRPRQVVRMSACRRDQCSCGIRHSPVSIARRNKGLHP